MKTKEAPFHGIPHGRAVGCVLSWQPHPDKKHNMARSALPSSARGGKLLCFDHVFLGASLQLSPAARYVISHQNTHI